MSRPNAILMASVLVFAGAIMAVCVTRDQMTSHLERGKAENVALNRDPFVIAWAALSYIKRTGHPPAAVSDCMIVETLTNEDAAQSTTRPLGLVHVQWPPNQADTILFSVLERVELWFPESPDDLTVKNGKLMLRNNGGPVQLISVRGVDQNDYPGLRNANIELWRGWLRLDKGEPTGIDWLDDYEPSDSDARQIGPSERP